ncbi:MAG: lipocalin-like domain-containing protein [Caldisericota bacterium]|nr:lipocalin-like domain-containing protein [Caldisericota bacterium]
MTDLDFLPHRGVSTEWWYFTGFLNQKFGFELTFFKIEFPPNVGILKLFPIQIVSHFAMTDIENKKFLFRERLSPVFHIGTDKILEIRNMNTNLLSNAQSYNLQADFKEYSMFLTLSPSKTIVPHGDNGITQMGNAGNSYYHSITSLKAKGTLKRKDEILNVKGSVWQDHQWGNFKIHPHWDWFSLRFNNNVDIMAFNLRDNKGNVINQLITIILEDGTILRDNTFNLQILDKDFYTGKNSIQNIGNLVQNMENFLFTR